MFSSYEINSLTFESMRNSVGSFSLPTSLMPVCSNVVTRPPILQVKLFLCVCVFSKGFWPTFLHFLFRKLYIFYYLLFISYHIRFDSALYFSYGHWTSDYSVLFNQPIRFLVCWMRSREARAFVNCVSNDYDLLFAEWLHNWSI